MKKKNIFIKILGLVLFRTRGTVLNYSGSLISPINYGNQRSGNLQARAEELLDLLAPVPIKSTLIHCGTKGDGGYVVSDLDLQNCGFLISGGIEANNEFEIELAEQGIQGIQIDNSIDAPPKTHPNLKFIHATLGLRESDIFSMNEFLLSRANGDVIVKLDIEGAELDVLLNLEKRALQKILCLVMELHNLDQIPNNEFWGKIETVLRRLKLEGLVSCFVSPNNITGTEVFGGVAIPRNIEITFTRVENAKKRFNVKDFAKIKELQMKNDASLSSINVDHLIYRKALSGG